MSWWTILLLIYIYLNGLVFTLAVFRKADQDVPMERYERITAYLFLVFWFIGWPLFFILGLLWELSLKQSYSLGTYLASEDSTPKI